METIGIPLAAIDIDTGEKTCPVCGEKFMENVDRNGEETSHRYSDHYLANHKDA